MKTYQIIRFKQNDGDQVVIETGLTLKEAKAWCKDPETSSRTCTDPELIQYTKDAGPWFDGYREE